MYFHRSEFVAVLLSAFLDFDFLKELLEVLKVGHVTTGSHDGVLADRVETLDVLEACKRAVRC